MNNNNNYVLIVLHASVDFLNAYYLLLFNFVTDTWLTYITIIISRQITYYKIGAMRVNYLI